MSSFRDAHRIYLFSLKGGGKKMAYGKSPEDALEVLSIRLTPEERAEIIDDDFIKIRQQDMQQYADQLR